MMIQIQKQTVLGDPILQKRLQNCLMGKYTKLYVFKDNSKEIAFVALDFRVDISNLILYEIFVTPKMHNKKYGLRIMKEIEIIGKNRDYKYIVLKPEKIDSNTNLCRLNKFYTRLGYFDISCGEMKKKI